MWAKRVYGGVGDEEQDQVHRAAYEGCYPRMEEFVNCVDREERKVGEDRVYKTRIKWRKKGEHERDISLRCREICREIVAGKSMFIPHLRFNYEAFCECGIGMALLSLHFQVDYSLVICVCVVRLQ